VTRIEKFGSELIKKEVIILPLIFFVSVLVRFYKLPKYLFFGFEQGRDAQITQNIYQLKQFTLIGPKTDLSGVFHGPWYYYLMTVPYAVSRGNPLAASFFLVLLSSFVGIIMYFLIMQVLKSKYFAVLAGFASAFSFEFIVYSRWLSNVTLTVPFIALAFLALWKYSVSKKSFWLVLSVAFAAFASQFEIILIFQFVFVYFLLLLLRIIKFPNLKTLFLCLAVFLFVFSPLIIFEFRHDHIIFKSLVGYAIGGQTKGVIRGTVLDSLFFYQLKLFTVIRKAIFLPDFIWAQIGFFLIFLFGLFKYWNLSRKSSV